MKILQLTTDLNHEGVSSYVILLSKHLKQQGHEVFCASSGGDGVYDLERYGIPHYEVFCHTKNIFHPKLTVALLQLIDVIKENEITLVHAHTRVAHVLASLLKDMLGVKFVSTCHGFYQKKLTRKMIPAWGDKCIVTSDALRTHLVNQFKVSRKKIEVIPNGIEFQKYRLKLTDKDRTVLKMTYGLQSHEKIIGCISRIEKTKGLHVLIEALPEILRLHPDTKVLFVGKGKYQSELMKLAESLEVDSHIKFLGEVDDVTYPLAVIDVFVQPSVRAEAFGLSVLEAMAMSKPVVATDVGNLYSLVKNEENGFLINARDKRALMKKVCYLLENPGIADEMGRRSREMISSSYSIDSIVSKILNVYKTVIA